MPMSYNELKQLVAAGVITNVEPEQINAASIDLTLGDLISVESPVAKFSVDLSVRKPRQYPNFKPVDINQGYEMAPGEFLLGSTQQKFYLPNWICADYRLNSSLARAGLNAALAMWADPGWHDAELTLELKNWLQYHTLTIRPGMRIGQMIFHRVETVPPEKSYGTIGSYNNQTGPTIR